MAQFGIINMKNGIKLKFYYNEPLSYSKYDGDIIVNKFSVENLNHNGFNFKKSLFKFSKHYLNIDGDLIIALSITNAFNNIEKNIFINTTKVSFINRTLLKWYCGLYWIQKEDNIRYIINIIFLILGCYLTYKQIKK
jgi:hypothetical protein